MSEKIKTQAQESNRRNVFLPDELKAIPDHEPPFWGGDWASRFVANFACPPGDDPDPRGAALAFVVNRAIERLAGLEQQIIVDYHVHCLARRMIALRHNLEESEVDRVRALAERRLRCLLADHVREWFRLTVRDDGRCPLCNSPRRSDIDVELACRRPRESWAALRRMINLRFGLEIKRVQVLMTHVRDHIAIPGLAISRAGPARTNCEVGIEEHDD